MELDKRDRQLLWELDGNSRQPLSHLGQKLRISKEAVFYRISNLENKKIITGYTTLVNLSKLGLMHFKIYIKLQNIQKQEKQKFLDYLIAHKNSNWVVTCRGTFDIICGFILKDIFQFANLRDEIIQKYSEFIHSLNYVLMKKSYHLGRNYFGESDMESKEYHGEPSSANLDTLDFRILKHLSTGTRTKSTELAKLLGSTPRVVSYKVNQMEKNNIILGYTISINHSILGISYFKTLFYIKNPQDKSKIMNYLSMQKNCIYAMEVLGNWDIEAEFEVVSPEEYYKAIDEIEERFSKSLKTITTTLIEKEHKFQLLPTKISGKY